MTEQDLRSMTIARIIKKLGSRAAEIIYAALCRDERRLCCPGATLRLEEAAEGMGKNNKLDEIIKALLKIAP